jgi:hypothetical protein
VQPITNFHCSTRENDSLCLLALEESLDMFDEGRSVLEEKAVSAIGVQNELPVGDLVVDKVAVGRGDHIVVLSKTYLLAYSLD